MHIKTLQLKNFRRFEEATFEFGPGFNLLVGENGNGKSSVLDAIFASLNDFGRMSGDPDGVRQLPEAADIKLEISKIRNKTRTDPTFVCEIKTKYFIENHSDILDQRHADPFDNVHPLNPGMAQYWGNYSAKLFKSQSFTLDLVARFVIPRNSNSKSRNKTTSFEISSGGGKLDAYVGWRDAGRGANALHNWVLFQSLADSQRENAKVDTQLSELQLVSSAVSSFLGQGLGLWFSGSLQSMMVDFEGLGNIPFDTLSDGQRGLIAMVADIARRACLLNPHLDDKVLEETPGIVLIDELDLHLHPKWQRSIVKNLKKTFPKIQFIATTHSPQIIGECKPEEIIIVTETGGKRPSQSFGMDSNWVLECLMETPARDKEIQAEIDQMFKAIDENEFGLARNLVAALREKIGPAPEVVKADILLHRYDGPHLAAGEAAE